MDLPSLSSADKVLPLDVKQDGPASEEAFPVQDGESGQPYRLYKRRWIGVFALVCGAPSHSRRLI